MLVKRFIVTFGLLFFFLAKPFAQVNLQTGSAMFSLPMFNWHDDKGRLSSVVGLNYNSGSGLKVNDMASNVGQGWNLVAGGVISRMQVGEPDDQKAYAGNGSDQDVTRYPAGYLYRQADPAAGCPKALTRYPTYGGQNVLYSQRNPIGEDKQQDYFTFQFNGKSGMFVLDKSGGSHGVMLGDSKVQISFQEDPSMLASGIRTTISAFSITDVDGLIYKFSNIGKTRLMRNIFSNADGTKVMNQPTIKNGGVYCQAAFDLGPTASPWTNQYMAHPYTINNWYLSEIDDTLTNRKVTFTYNTLNLNVAAGQDIAYNSSSNSYVMISFKKSVTTTLEIATINLPDGHAVQFNYSPTARLDYPGEKAVASVDILYQGRSVSKYQLNTTYFILNRYGTPTTPYQKSVSRLCLKSVKKIGVDLKDETPPYTFDYFLGSNGIDDFVPPPFFYAKDIWGYYNGNNSIASNSPLSGSTIPVNLNAPLVSGLPFNSLKGLCFQNDHVSGTYYNAKPGFAQNGLLKQIIYPTGGSLNYQYAQNTGSFIGNSAVLNVGGVHVSQTSTSDGGYSNGCGNQMTTQYNYVVNGPGSASSLWGMETPVNSFVANNSWAEEHQTIHFSFSHPFGECKWHYIYPGILSQYESVSIESWQKIMNAISPVLGVLGVISTISDVINVIGGSTGIGAIAAVVMDVISAVLGYFFSCPQQTKYTANTMYYDFDLNQASPLPAQFKRVEVTESPGTIGKTVYQFTHGDPSDPAPDHYYPLWDAAGGNSAHSAKQRFAPWAYGLPWLTTVFDASNNKIKETQSNYDFTYAQEGIWDPLTVPGNCCAVDVTRNASCKCNVITSYSQRSDDWGNSSKYNDPSTYVTSSYADMGVDIYYFYTGRAMLSKTFERTYRTSDVTQFVQTETDYLYNTGGGCTADNACQWDYNNYEIRGIITHESNGDVDYKYMYYPGDYNSGILATLARANILSPVVATQSYVVKGATGNVSYLSEKVTEFARTPSGDIKPSRLLEQRFTKPSLSFTAYSGPVTTNYSNYKITRTMAYDSYGNLAGSIDEGTRSIANIYDYNDKYIVASVINADPIVDGPAYTSFETDDLTRSGWTINGARSINHNVAAETGNSNFTLQASGANNLAKTGMNTGRAYILSFWASNGNVSVSSGATQSKVGPAYNGFTYYEYAVAKGTSSVTLSNSTSSAVNIDELRLYPSDSRMQTSTYDPLLGKTSECDGNNRITYYTYDNLGRLQFIKDESSNVVKMYEYNTVSAMKQTGCPVSFSNHLVSELVTRSNCSSGYQAGAVTYTVAAGTFTSTISQQDADIKAELYLLTNGQNYANSNASCSLIYYNTAQSASPTTQGCGDGMIAGTVTYTVPAATYSSIISQADADAQAAADLAANAQVYANTIASPPCTIDTNPDWTYLDGSPTYCANVNGQTPAHLMMLATDGNPNSPSYQTTSWQDAGPSDQCPAPWYNADLSGDYYSQVCPGGYSANAYFVSVPPGTYTSNSSLADANNQATQAAQQQANQNGSCQAPIENTGIQAYNNTPVSVTVEFSGANGYYVFDIPPGQQLTVIGNLPVGIYDITFTAGDLSGVAGMNYIAGCESVNNINVDQITMHNVNMTIDCYSLFISANFH